jgi:hypothetical protein
MKKLVYLIAGAMLFSISCKPDLNRYCCDVAQRAAEITAQKNGELWAPSAVKGTLSNIDSLSIYATGITASLGTITKLDSMAVKIAYISPGLYKLNSNQVFYATFNPDGTLNSYKLDTTFNNVINISGYQVLDNPATTNPNEVKFTGTFSIKFVDPKNPAGISFSNGSFFAIMNQ